MCQRPLRILLLESPKCSPCCRGCGKKLEIVRVTSLEFFFPGTKVPFLNGIFFSGGVVWNFLNLKGYVFVYVLHVSGHEISVKGALGVGGGGEECLKTYTSLRTRDGIVL